MIKIILSILAGVILGFLSARTIFVGSWLSLVPWAMAGLLVGYWSGKRQAIINGALYGFAIAFTFMLAGYSGSASLVSRVPFFALLGLIGAVCGAALGFTGGRVRNLVEKRPNPPA
jgi:hypothetical protein